MGYILCENIIINFVIFITKFTKNIVKKYLNYIITIYMWRTTVIYPVIPEHNIGLNIWRKKYTQHIVITLSQYILMISSKRILKIIVWNNVTRVFTKYLHNISSEYA